MSAHLRRIALPALLACLSLAACGGSASTASTATTAAREAAAEHLPVAPLKVPGGGSERFLVPGGDSSVQEYGSEAGEAELREAAEAVHSFYVARARGEWARACGFLSAAQAESLEKLASSSPKPHGKGCPGALGLVTKRPSPSLSRALTTVDAASLRREGSQAFLIYTAPPGRTAYAMPLVGEGGEWRLGAISGAVLPGTP